MPPRSRRWRARPRRTPPAPGPRRSGIACSSCAVADHGGRPRRRQPVASRADDPIPRRSHPAPSMSLDRFDAIADLFDRVTETPLHRRLRASSVAPLRPLAGRTVLDLGTGPGGLAVDLALEGARV